MSKLTSSNNVDSASVFNDSIIMMSSRVEEDLIVEGNIIMRKYIDDSAVLPQALMVNPNGDFVTLGDIDCMLNDGQGNYMPQWKYHFNQIYTYCPEQSFHVGINTDNPIQALDVRGNQYLSGNMGLGVSQPTQKLEVQGNQYLSGRLGIDAIGRVGIGMSNPSTNLEIQNGALKISGSHGDDGDTRFLIDAGSTSQHFLRFTNGNGDMLFVNNEGKLYAHEIEVKLGSFSDFVFHDDYKLRTLTEVEQYINTHKHLPDVPSEQEVIENGLNLGEMDALLLQKVEELTLYVIELQKQIEKLKEGK